MTGGRRVVVVLVDERVHPVGGERFQRGGQSGAREGMCIDADEQRPVHARRAAMPAERLADRQDMRLVEAAGEG